MKLFSEFRLRAISIVNGARKYVARYVAVAEQRIVLDTALDNLQREFEEEEIPPLFLALLFLTYSSIRGEEESAQGIAVAATLLYLGIDLHDDIADGDLPDNLKTFGATRLSLAAATLISSLPHLVISELGRADEDRLRATLHRTVAEGLLKMAGGQDRDLLLTGSVDARADQVEASIREKSGEEIAMLARLAAHVAGAPAPLVSLYDDIGRALGTAGQLASDLHDLFTAPLSRDLRRGTRTYPIALHLDKLKGKQRAAFLNTLTDARAHPAAQDAVRRELRSAGVLRHCAFVVEIYCQKALQSLHEARPSEPGASSWRALIDEISLFPTPVSPQG